MVEDLALPPLEVMSPVERGQWLLSEAQHRLIEEATQSVKIEQEYLKAGKSSEEVLEYRKEHLRRVESSPNVVYQRRGNTEYLKGSTHSHGEINVHRPYGGTGWHGSEWELYGSAARRRGELAAEIALEVGFDVLGKGIPPKPEWEEVDSYDLPPRLEMAPVSYQNRAAEAMKKEISLSVKEDKPFGIDDRKLIELGEKYLAIDRSMNLTYAHWYGGKRLGGRLDGKPLEIEILGYSLRAENGNWIGTWWGRDEMEEQEARDIWSTYAGVVSDRQVRASNMWENEKHILEQLKVA